MTRAVKRRKSDRVLNDLGMQIVSGQRAPGDRLPREHDLSRRLGISRPSLREGLKALVQKGLIEPRTGRGTTINEKHRWNVLDADVLRWIAEAPPDREFYRTLLEARTIIEPAAARLAAARASHETILGLEHAYHAMARALPRDVEACCRHDLALHELIILATANPIASKVFFMVPFLPGGPLCPLTIPCCGNRPRNSIACAGYETRRIHSYPG